MSNEINLQLSTVGAYYPDSTLAALKRTYLTSGRCVALPPRNSRWYFTTNDEATLSVDDAPLHFKVVGVLRECAFSAAYPHITIIPLFERDAATFDTLTSGTTVTDWDLNPDGLRAPVHLAINKTRDVPTIDATSTFSNGAAYSDITIPSIALKRNDIIIAHTTAHLEASFVAPPRYSFTVHQLTLVHSATDQEAGL
ncbi:hypothetical protein FKP32DRAFT_1679998 [Trametes sanguinea]|nr:hypothetical protein FKP32DRAFT_1679998 [Trametes sanguinea]